MTNEGSRAILRGHCPNCDADRNAEVLAEDTFEEELDPRGVWVKSTYSILRCLGCDRGFIRRAELCSEDEGDYDVDAHTEETSITLNERVAYWPSITSTSRTTRRRPDWLSFNPRDPLDPFDPLELGLAFVYLNSPLYCPNSMRHLITICRYCRQLAFERCSIAPRSCSVATLTRVSRKSSTNLPQGSRSQEKKRKSFLF